jgi:hypothetical protein
MTAIHGHASSWDNQPRIGEPTLCELFEDPLTHLLMASDGVEPRWLWNLLMEIADRHSRGDEASLSLE